MLLTGCGAGDDSAKVEASLQQYMGSFHPENLPFPIGAGIPRVQEKGCKDRHVKTEERQVLSSRNVTVMLRGSFALWSCVVRFRTFAVPVLVAVDDGSNIGLQRLASSNSSH